MAVSGKLDPGRVEAELAFWTDEVLNEQFIPRLAFAYRRRWNALLSTCKNKGTSVDSLFLDIACGTGSGISELLNLSPRIIGVDLSINALKIYRSRLELSVIAASAEQLPFADDTFDFVIANGFLHHTFGWGGMDLFL